MVRCGDNSLYTGIAKDLTARMLQHNSGKGARYTRGRRPVKLVYQEGPTSYSAALKREHQIKKLTRKQKILLLES